MKRIILVILINGLIFGIGSGSGAETEEALPPPPPGFTLVSDIPPLPPGSEIDVLPPPSPEGRIPARFSIVIGEGIIVRIDTMTGRAWLMVPTEFGGKKFSTWRWIIETEDTKKLGD